MAASITPASVPQGARSRIQASTMLLSQWLASFRASTIHLFNVRLGGSVQTAPGITLPPNLQAMLRVFNRYADAISISDAEIEVIEAKVVAEPGAISQIETYAALIPSTPMLAQYTGRRIVPSLVFATDDEIVRQKAVAAGIRYNVFTPAWIADYLTNRYYRLARSS